MAENRKETQKQSASPEPSFESAMQRLDEIIEQMESNRLPLEDLLRGYEDGLKLVKLCSEKLDAAEKRIEIITRDAMGKPKLADFESAKPVPPTSTAPASSNVPPSSNPPASRSEEISLF